MIALVLLLACGDPPGPAGRAPAGLPPAGTPPHGGAPAGRAKAPAPPPEPLVPGGLAEPPDAWRCESRTASIDCFRPVPGGRYRLGAQATDTTAPGHDPAALPLEGPVREVELAPFWLQWHELTANTYERCVQSGWCPPDGHATGPGANVGRDDRRMHPANGLSWAAAARVCAWLGGRLPTEVEWEAAARGPEGRRFPWGDDVHCGIRLAVADQGARATMAPPCTNEGTRNPNELSVGASGFVAQAGNVWEWTSDAWTPPDGGPVRRLQRGGGWMERDPDDLRAAVRVAADPEARLVDVGVRCAWPGP